MIVIESLSGDLCFPGGSLSEDLKQLLCFKNYTLNHVVANLWDIINCLSFLCACMGMPCREGRQRFSEPARQRAKYWTKMILVVNNNYRICCKISALPKTYHF